MPRKGYVEQREVKPDPLYGSDLVQKFVNCIMYDGKRSTAQQIVYESFELIKQKTSDDPLKVFKKALEM